jgi:large subunit ribosomal protein L21
MKYAVVRINGHQYRVEEGQEIVVDKLEAKKSQEIEIPEVLLVVDGERLEIGQPLISQTKIKAKVLENLKGEKVRIAHFRAKSRYRKTRGFRALLTRIRIEKIETAKTPKTAKTQKTS